MPLKLFGPNRMAAQQGHEDSGTSLVRNRPSWGMGPQGMPGSFDYNPSPTESRRGGQGGNAPRTPNMHEQGGFFWTGSSVAQGTPIAHQNQRLEMTAQDNARRWASQAMDDKAHNLQVRNVDARIRQADAGQDLQERKFGLDTDFAGQRMNLEADRFSKGHDLAERGLKLKEDFAPLQFTAIKGQEQRAGELHQEQVEGARTANRQGRLQLDAAEDQMHFGRRRGGVDVSAVRDVIGKNSDRYDPRSVRDAMATGDASRLRVGSMTADNPQKWINMFQRINPDLRATAGRDGQLTPDAERDIAELMQRVDELANEPRFSQLGDVQLANLAADGAFYDSRSNAWYIQRNGQTYRIDD